MEYTVKPPVACKAEELTGFYKLLLERGRINECRLAKRISRARLLGFCYAQSRLVAIVALKRIRRGNVLKIFSHAGVPELAPAYRYELGWAYVKAGFRRQGLAYNLTEKLFSVLSANTDDPHRKKIFALVRVENLPAINLLGKFHFKRIGHPYPGREAHFVLYVRD